MYLKVLAILMATAGTQLPSSCSQCCDDEQPTGAIVGAVVPVPGSLPENRLYAPATVTIAGSDQRVMTDEKGRFVFDRIGAGLYDVVARLDSLEGRTVEVTVQTDSAAIVPVYVDSRGDGPVQVEWRGVTVAKREISNRGAVAGQASFHDRTRPLPCGTALVRIPGTFWTTESDTLGRFRIPDVIPGNYDVIATHGCRRRFGPSGELIPPTIQSYISHVVGVEVLHGRVSVVDTYFLCNKAMMPHRCGGADFWEARYEDL